MPTVLAGMNENARGALATSFSLQRINSDPNYTIGKMDDEIS
jgi:hypothetical protein